METTGFFNLSNACARVMQRVEEEKARYGLEFDIPIRSELSMADLDSVEGTKIARAEIAKAKKAGIL
jgi:hypothetical protein